MNRYFCILAFLFLWPLLCFSQNRINVWMLSKQFVALDCGIDFNSGFADTFSVWKELEFFATNASICDSIGELLFYTNGIYIANKENDSLKNCNGFNPGYATDYYADDGLGVSQGAIILPKPELSSSFTVFHISGEELDNGSQLQPLHLRYSEVDMNDDNGLGGVVAGKKGVSILNDTLVWGRLTACKHANGRDWWIITHRWNSDLYYKFLLTPDTIIGPMTQHIGSAIIKDDIVGQACFSPDGSKFGYINRNYNFDYMEFNRCTGEFYNHVNIVLPDSNLSQGISFSPNSRFIYCNTYTQLFQFDTWSPDLAASMILIDTIPFVQPGIDDWFAVEMLAPDNKIYISTYNGVKAMHVINYPDLPGTDCAFERKGLTLPTYNLYAIPNHPNYDLGPLPGSECDTLYLSNIPANENSFSFLISPNPSSTNINIVYNTKETCFFNLFDINGKTVASVTLYHYFKNRLLDVSGLPGGIYFAHISCNGEKIWSEKVIVQH